MNQYGFVFEPDRCVGCHACIIGCTIENGTDPGLNLREVLIFNPSIISDIPHYNLSLACNHCQYPPCVDQCPAKAIRKDQNSGIVVINGDRCIGCTYCSWACPYGAPVFNGSKGVMTKCDFCAERVGEGFKPACETVCPTGALSTDRLDPELVEQHIDFFPKTGVFPAVSIETPAKSPPPVQQYINTYPAEVLQNFSADTDQRRPQVSLMTEWPLLLFTILISVLGLLFAGDFLAGDKIDPVMFGTGVLSGILISLIHLGKKGRSFRIIFNFSRSWLSRESLFFSLFLVCSSLSISEVFNPVSGLAAFFSLYLTAFSADMIYISSEAVRKDRFHSSQVTITLSMFILYAVNFTEGLILLFLIKIYLYIWRKVKYGFRNPVQIFLSFLRIVPGGIVPVILVFLHGGGGVTLPLFLLGEITDRGEFYHEFEILTPGVMMNKYLNLEIRGTSSGRPGL